MVTTLIEKYSQYKQADGSYRKQYTVNNKEQLRRILEEVDQYCPNTDLNWIDTSKLTDMSMLFFRLENINCKIDKWDTSNVRNMCCMFKNAVNFNQPLQWDTSNVRSMYCMFYGAISFNQPLPWDTSNVKDMGSMFNGASSFNQPLQWDFNSVLNVESMFRKSGLTSETLVQFIKTVNINMLKNLETLVDKDIITDEVLSAVKIRLLLET